MTHLSQTLQQLMTEHRIRMADLSRETGISPPVINRLVNSITTNPNVDTLRPLANYFSISISQLMGDEPLEKNPHHKIAIIDWNYLFEWQTQKNTHAVIGHIYSEHSLSTQAFALRLTNSSMEPRFPKGSILIVNPDSEPQDHDHVIVRLTNQDKPLFKQVLFDGDTVYLKSYNRDIQVIKINNNFTITGVVVETRLRLS